MKNLLIRLSDEAYEKLKLQAYANQKSMSAIVREVMTSYLEGEPLKESDPLLSLSGNIASGRKDGAQQHDKYLYRK